jgi:hypothetical protein
MVAGRRPALRRTRQRNGSRVRRAAGHKSRLTCANAIAIIARRCNMTAYSSWPWRGATDHSLLRASSTGRRDSRNQPYRRISRYSRGQRSSRCATLIPEGEETERRLGAREPSDAYATCGTHISHSSAQAEPAREGGWQPSQGCWQGAGSGSVCLRPPVRVARL